MRTRLWMVTAILCSQPAWGAIGGLYGTKCLPLAGLSAVKDILLEAEHFEMIQTIYADDSCQTPAYDFVFTGSLHHDAELGTIDLSFDSIELTPLGTTVAQAFRDSVVCGLQTWQSEVSIDVAGLSCGEQMIPRRHELALDIIKETAGGIVLGLPSSDEKRPLEFDTIEYFAR